MYRKPCNCEQCNIEKVCCTNSFLLIVSIFFGFDVH